MARSPVYAWTGRFRSMQANSPRLISFAAGNLERLRLGGIFLRGAEGVDDV